jgi:hypothetical protein
VEGIVFAFRAKVANPECGAAGGKLRIVPSEIDKLILSLERPSPSEFVLPSTANREASRSMIAHKAYAQGIDLILNPTIRETAGDIKQGRPECVAEAAANASEIIEARIEGYAQESYMIAYARTLDIRFNSKNEICTLPVVADLSTTEATLGINALEYGGTANLSL